MLQVYIRGKDKRTRKLPKLKKKPWEKETNYSFKEAEIALRTIFQQMEAKGIKEGMFQFILNFDGTTIESSDIAVSITSHYPLLEELIRQDVISSLDENTTKEQERITQELLKTISEETGEIHKNRETEKQELIQTPIQSEKRNSIKKEKPTEVDQLHVVLEEGEPTEKVTKESEEEMLEIELTSDSEEQKSNPKNVSNREGTAEIGVTGYLHYIQPSLPENRIQETLKNYSEENLLEQLTSNEQDSEEHDLDEKRTKQIRSFFFSYLKNTPYQPIIQAYKGVINDVKVESSRELAEKYKELHVEKPEQIAEQEIDEVFAPVKTTYNQKYHEYEQEKQQALSDFIESKEKEKQVELEQFKQELDQRYTSLISEETDKTEKELTQYKNELAGEVEQSRTEVYQSLVSDCILKREQELIDFKTRKETHAQEEIETATLNLISRYTEILEACKLQLSELIPQWDEQALREKELKAKQMEEKRLLHKQEEEKRLKQKELALEEEKLALKKKELETPKAPEIHYFPTPQPTMTTMNTDNTNIQQVEKLLKEMISEKRETKSDQSRIIKTVAVSLMSTVALGGLLFLGYENNQTKQQLLDSQTKMEQIVKEREKSEKKQEQEKQAYFAEKVADLKEKELKEKEAQEDELTTAIKEKDNSKIIASYEKLKEKKTLSEEQKNAVKVAYFTENKLVEAKKVGE